MTGTEKQRAWAEKIRASKELEEHAKRSNDPLRSAALEYLQGIEDHNFWIMHRHTTLYDIIYSLVYGSGLVISGSPFDGQIASMDKDGKVSVHAGHIAKVVEY